MKKIERLHKKRVQRLDTTWNKALRRAEDMHDWATQKVGLLMSPQLAEETNRVLHTTAYRHAKTRGRNQVQLMLRRLLRAHAARLGTRDMGRTVLRQWLHGLVVSKKLRLVKM